MLKFITNTRIRPIALFLLGAICVLGFAPFYFYPASFISLIGLFYFWHQGVTAKQAAISGFIYALGLFCVGIYWIYISLHDFGNMPTLFAALATFLLCAFMALFTALVGALSVKFSASKSQYLLISIPVFWALADWTRGWIFTGFPWLTMGYSQVPYSSLAGYMPIIGVYGVSLLTVFIANLIGFWLARKPSSVIWKRNTIAAILLILIVGSVLKLVGWTHPVNKPISVALLQGNIAQDIKWAPETSLQILQKYLDLIEASSAQLVITPETALPVLSNEIPDELVARLKQHAKQHNSTILLGLIERENGEYFNSLLKMDASADVQTYRKSHLVPFGEFIPLKAAFGWIYRDWLNMPLSDLSRGHGQQLMAIAGEKIAINICYEDVFGEEIIRQLPQATMLVNASNDAWYGQSYAAHQHLQFSQARALETGRTMLRATNTGATAMIDPYGNVLAHAPHFTTTTLNVLAQGYSGSTPYVRWGNWPFIIFCFTVLGCLLFKNFTTETQRHREKQKQEQERNFTCE